MFHKATKVGTKLRCAIFGPAGSGKTFTALRMAGGIGGRIALIDTERRTASKYADRFDFDVCNLGDRSIDGYLAAMHEARDYDVLVIDSLTHAWHELLNEVERLARAKYRGNTFAAWSEGTPRQKTFIDALYDSPCHVIATMRSATEWQTVNDGGRARPQRVGLKPEQGKGIEFEFDVLMQLSPDHVAEIIKDRTGGYQDAVIDKPGEDLGRKLAEWLSTATPIAAAGGDARRAAGGTHNNRNQILKGTRCRTHGTKKQKEKPRPRRSESPVAAIIVCESPKSYTVAGTARS
ncbi:MAG: ATP-binding protein [Planctomycetota bacterium]